MRKFVKTGRFLIVMTLVIVVGLPLAILYQLLMLSGFVVYKLMEIWYND